MRFVDDESVIGIEPAVAVGLRQQNPVGHYFDQIVAADAIAKAHLVTDRRAERGAQLVRQSRGHGARGDAARLRAADNAVHAASDFEADLRQLCGLAGTGLTADDDDLMARDSSGNFVAARVDGQRRGGGGIALGRTQRRALRGARGRAFNGGLELA